MPYALDADVADQVYVGTTLVSEVGELVGSVDRTRRLFDVSGVSRLAPLAPQPPEAFDLAALATAAQLLGCGERLLADTVTYAKQRRQFGREIGSYQALKHRLADVRIALDFARPLLIGAALVPTARPTRPRDVSAAKVACGDAAYLASRTALQVHGAIGYTREFDLSLWITKVRALVTAWGTPAYHRARVLEGVASDGVRPHRGAAGARDDGPLAAGQARRQRGRAGGGRLAARATTSRCGRRCASRSAWPRSASRRSTTASAFSLFEGLRSSRGAGPNADAQPAARHAGDRRGAAGRRRRARPPAAAPPDRGRRDGRDRPVCRLCDRGRRPAHRHGDPRPRR